MINIRNTKIFNILSKNYVAKASGFYSLSQLINSLTTFGVLALYTKSLPPADFGKIFLIWIFVTIVSTLTNGGLSTAFSIKFYKLSKEESTKNIYSIFTYYLVMFIIFYLIFLIFPSLFQKVSMIKVSGSDLTTIFLLILFMTFGNFYTNILMVDKKPKIYFFVKLVFNSTVIISSLIYLLILKSGYIAYLKAYLISYLVVSLIGLRFFIFDYTPHRNIISSVNLKNLLKIGLPLVPNGLMLMLLTWADRYILNLYVGLSIVGIYGVGYKFARTIESFAINPFGQAMTPISFKLFAKSPREYKNLLAKTMNYYWLLFFGIMTGYFTILREVFQLLIDVKYVEGYNIICIILIGIIIWGATNYLGGIVLMKEKTHRMFLFTSISVSLNIGLNFILIPKYGMYGAAVATLLAYVLQFIMIFVYTQKLIHINYDYRFIFKSILISLFFFAFVLFISYLNVNIAIGLMLKIIVFSFFILTAFKFLDFKKFVKEILSYGVISKQSAC